MLNTNTEVFCSFKDKGIHELAEEVTEICYRMKYHKETIGLNQMTELAEMLDDLKEDLYSKQDWEDHYDEGFKHGQKEIVILIQLKLEKAVDDYVDDHNETAILIKTLNKILGELEELT